MIKLDVLRAVCYCSQDISDVSNIAMKSLASYCREMSFLQFVINVGVQCFGFTLFVILMLVDIYGRGGGRTDIVYILVGCIACGVLWGSAMKLYFLRDSRIQQKAKKC